MAFFAQKFREMVFLTLYSQDFGPLSDQDFVGLLMKELKVNKRLSNEALLKANLIVEKIPEIDKMIEKASTEYSLDRISTVEKVIIRLGLYEIFYESKVSAKIAISEAIRLTRKFGTPQSAQFVNALLDVVYKSGIDQTQPSEEPAIS